MRSSVAAPLALLATGAAAADCAKGLYIIVARGSTEMQGPGITGTLADEVVDQIKGSEIYSVVYPATLEEYQDSVITGSKAAEKAVTDYVKTCPDGKIALMGYSQGAHAAMNALCGSEQNGFANLTALPSDIVEKNVVAVTLFGDPTHVANLTIEKGTSKEDGLFPRPDYDTCKPYFDMIGSWCDSGDVYCDSGSNKTVHGTYFKKYGPEIVKFIVDKYNSAVKGGSGSNSTATGTGSGAKPTGSHGGSNSTMVTTAKPTASATGGSGSGSETSSGAGASQTSSVPGAAAGLDVASKAAYLAVPAAVVAMLQML